VPALAPADLTTVPREELARIFESWNQAFNRAAAGVEVEEYLSLFHPDATFQPATARFEGALYRGHAGIREYFERLRETFEDLTLELEHLEALDERTLLTCSKWCARGAGSGAAAEAEAWAMVELRDGRATSLRAATSREELQ
jgi:ketosteroid isomerase-like protein